MKLIFVRHGEALSNVKNIVGGQTEFPLTKCGIEQAKKVGKRLKNVKIDVVFCSPLKRAKETAKEIMKYHNNLDVIYDKEIMEGSFGIFENKPIEEFLTALEAYEGPTETFKPDGGESLVDVFERAKLFSKKFESYKGKTVLIVAHGRIIRAIVGVILNKNIKEMMKTRFLNTSVTTLELKENKYEALDYNCTKHLV